MGRKAFDHFIEQFCFSRKNIIWYFDLWIFQWMLAVHKKSQRSYNHEMVSTLEPLHLILFKIYLCIFFLISYFHLFFFIFYSLC